MLSAVLAQIDLKVKRHHMERQKKKDIFAWPFIQNELFFILCHLDQFIW